MQHSSLSVYLVCQFCMPGSSRPWRKVWAWSLWAIQGRGRLQMTQLHAQAVILWRRDHLRDTLKVQRTPELEGGHFWWRGYFRWGEDRKWVVNPETRMNYNWTKMQGLWLSGKADWSHASGTLDMKSELACAWCLWRVWCDQAGPQERGMCICAYLLCSPSSL